MNMRRAYVTVMILIVFLAVGCGPRGIRYTATLHDLTCSSSRSIAVAVLDERPYILKKEKDPSYVGLIRGGYGNPFDMWTESGAPLAEDMLHTITDSLRARGFKVTPLKTAAVNSREAALAGFKAADTDRLLLLVIREWYSDYIPAAYTPERSNLFVHVEAGVFNRNQKKTAGKNLMEDLTLPSGWPYETIPSVYQSKISGLINDSRICRALQ
jgi:hypothetical protein